MKILTHWLRSYLPPVPVSDHQLADDLTLRGIAVEGVHRLGTAASGESAGCLFEMDITTNRVDAMNHYGIAREVAAIYNLPLAPLEVSQKTSFRPERSAVEKPSSLPQMPPPSFPLRIEAPRLCGRFTAQVLRGVTIASSTGTIAEYFQLLGQKLISNAVDASNFVLLGMGHPTHAFDLDRIEGGIIVRLARQGEKLKLLDSTERTLEADDLVVADEAKPLALAGVMGGWDSMITSATKNILVEAAWFDPASVRRSARRHGLHTDASHRFERGADFNAAPIANRLVSQLILQAGGHPEGELIDLIIPETAACTANRSPIELSVYQVQRHLGATLDDTHHQSALTPALIHQYLTALGCTLTAFDSAHKLTVKKTGLVPGIVANASIASADNGGSASADSSFRVQLPSWRLDLEREIDLIEEVARVHGYNRFANTLPTPGIVIAHPLAGKEAAVRNRLLALGFSESISSTFASQFDADLFYTPKTDLTEDSSGPSFAVSPQTGVPASFAGGVERVGYSQNEPSPPTPKQTPVPLENPLSEEASLLRPSLIPGMVAMLSHNLNRDVKEVRLFEQGHIFTGDTLPDSSAIEAVHESPQLSLGLTTPNPQPTPLHPASDAPFFELKGVLESVISLFATPGGPAALSFTAEAPAWLQPGRAATALVNNQPIACFGELAHTQRDARKLRQPIYLAQLDLASLYANPLKNVTAHDLSRFQAVERDFSFTFPDTIQWHTIAAAIHALAIPELQRLTPTEIFRDPKGKSVPMAHYALLLKCVFQSTDHTLRDDELTSWWSAIISTLTQLDGIIRAPAESL